MGVDKYQIAANVTLAGLDGFKGRLSAKRQREVFGAALFGKKLLRIDARNQGTVEASFSVCFGTDRNSSKRSFEEIAKAANNGQRLVF